MKTLSILKYLMIFLLLAGMSCEEKLIDPEFTIGEDSTFRINQLVSSADGQYTLLIKEISDSRCPEGVVCVWQGEVTVKGEWTTDKIKSAFEIHSVLDQENKVPDGFTMKIVDAKPFPKFGTDSNPEDLVITLLIKKK